LSKNPWPKIGVGLAVAVEVAEGRRAREKAFERQQLDALGLGISLERLDVAVHPDDRATGAVFREPLQNVQAHGASADDRDFFQREARLHGLEVAHAESRDRHRLFADGRLRADALCRLESEMKHAVESGRGTEGRGPVGLFELPQNLGLAEDQRLQRGRDPKQMADRGLAFEVVAPEKRLFAEAEMLQDLHPFRAGIGVIIFGGGVELDPVARIDVDQILEPVARELLQPRLALGGIDVELLAHSRIATPKVGSP
jgi:hypothetical protein